ncbi:MAG: hypothetical protein AAF171_14070 [Cyanobacteria bacterium P01_A01_bin.116]
MLKKTLAFGLLAAGTIGLAVPAQAQNVVSGAQSIHSQTVGVNGSSVLSVNDQELNQVLIDNDFGSTTPFGGPFGEPNLVTGAQDIGSATVGANSSNVLSANEQAQTEVLIDSDAYYSDYGYPAYPTYPTH